MAKKRRNGTVRILEPEILPPVNEATPLSAQGKLPALQESLRTDMSTQFQRCQDAAEQLKRILSARAEMYESAVRDAQRAYEQSRDELRDLGV